MQRPLGLHQLTAIDLDPIALIKAAAAAGYDQVSLFTNNPVVPLEGQESKFVFPRVTQKSKQHTIDCLNSNGLNVINVEFFLIRPDVNLETYIPGLALGRALGAVNAITHIFEPDASRAVDLLGAFCDLAAREDLNVALEFCQMTPGCKNIEQASWFVDQVEKSNLGFGICPMHLIRSGGSAADVADRGVRYLRYGQINDGHGLHTCAKYFDEVHDRELPGNGDFPLHDILNALPPDAPIEVKIPSDRRRNAGRSAQDYIHDAFSLCRALVDGLTDIK